MARRGDISEFSTEPIPILDDYSQRYIDFSNENVIATEMMDTFWWWIIERQKIWHKRTVQRLPQPWTDDKILQHFSFTNAFRELDKGTIHYINHVLGNYPEHPTEIDIKNNIINTIIFRLYIKRETIETIGFLHVDNWEKEFEEAKQKLRAKRDSKESIFHAAYVVPSLTSYASESEPNNKLEASFNFIQTAYEELDYLYKALTETDNLDNAFALLENHKPFWGAFTIYEWLCDWGTMHRYVRNPFTKWDDDTGVNLGPGAIRMISYIFPQLKPNKYRTALEYLRHTAEKYVSKSMPIEEFWSLCPPQIRKFTYRAIEHSLCEVGKYVNTKYFNGRTRTTFKDMSKSNLDSLLIKSI